MIDTLSALTLFAFVSSVTPGPNNLMLLSSGTRFGFRRTIPHMLGIAVGFVLMIVLVGLGLARLFEVFPQLQLALTIASVAYLLFLAWKIATAKAPATGDETVAGKPLTFLQAAAFQWVNPKAWTMALTALSAYMPRTDPWTGIVIVAAVCGMVNLPSVSVWAAMGSQMRRFLAEPRKLRAFNLTAAALLVVSLYPTIAHG
ncbi:MAG: LysE family translocator [Sphingomonas sp.]|uniref:LysE family translocator n=1 Tax=Sphingomonas sp. TaxID=28214 RepID=UPI00181BEC20|nr:LysE family translocator [Sphingomonas sp.]MBA3667785.1 LysE family translocator [Sphingomonas sp.]